MRCTVAEGKSEAEADFLKLSWGCFWNISCTFSTVCSLVQGLPLPPLWEIFALSINRVCHCMILFRAGGSFLIGVSSHRCVLVTDWFRIYSATTHAFSWGVKRILVPDFNFEICPFFLVLQLDMEHRCKVEQVFYNPSKTQQKSQNINTISIESKKRADASNQTKQKINFPLKKMWPMKALSMKIWGCNLIVLLYHIPLNLYSRSR